VTFTDIAPAIPLVAFAGLVAWFIIRGFRRIKVRPRVRDEFRSPDDNTRWVLGWNDKPDPVRPDQLTVYTGTARVHAIEGKTRDAEVVSDERLVKR
jgi:hypothetical protein